VFWLWEAWEGIVAIAAPANASNIYPGPIYIDPYSVSLYSFNDCQSVEVLAGPGLPAFNYQLGGVGGWVELWKVAPNGTEVDSGGAFTSAIPGYVLWGDNHANLSHGEYVARIWDDNFNTWYSNDISC
jgi:hypothetical protein